MNAYYISLCRGLTGHYVLVHAPDEETVRKHALEYFGKIWCTIYTDAYFFEILRRRYPTATKVVNPSKPIILAGGWQWE